MVTPCPSPPPTTNLLASASASLLSTPSSTHPPHTRSANLHPPLLLRPAPLSHPRFAALPPLPRTPHIPICYSKTRALHVKAAATWSLTTSSSGLLTWQIRCSAASPTSEITPVSATPRIRFCSRRIPPTPPSPPSAIRVIAVIFPPPDLRFPATPSPLLADRSPVQPARVPVPAARSPISAAQYPLLASSRLPARAPLASQRVLLSPPSACSSPLRVRAPLPSACVLLSPPRACSSRLPASAPLPSPCVLLSSLRACSSPLPARAPLPSACVLLSPPRACSSPLRVRAPLASPRVLLSPPRACSSRLLARHPPCTPSFPPLHALISPPARPHFPPCRLSLPPFYAPVSPLLTLFHPSLTRFPLCSLSFPHTHPFSPLPTLFPPSLTFLPNSHFSFTPFSNPASPFPSLLHASHHLSLPSLLLSLSPSCLPPSRFPSHLLWATSQGPSALSHSSCHSHSRNPHRRPFLPVTNLPSPLFPSFPPLPPLPFLLSPSFPPLPPLPFIPIPALSSLPFPSRPRPSTSLLAFCPPVHVHVLPSLLPHTCILLTHVYSLVFPFHPPSLQISPHLLPISLPFHHTSLPSHGFEAPLRHQVSYNL
ncbi:unnamed protein product [Closterium sp. Naga37s-1]|nr:unnamed protein product [Closterium sp. Naga37s-1]